MDEEELGPSEMLYRERNVASANLGVAKIVVEELGPAVITLAHKRLPPL